MAKSITDLEQIREDARRARYESELVFAAAATAVVQALVLAEFPTATYVSLELDEGDWDTMDSLNGVIFDATGDIVAEILNDGEYEDIYDALQDLPRNAPTDDPRFECYYSIPECGYGIDLARVIA